ncbi:hypothetical protein QLL95_gp0180 [Cotonvirus japonicus]|uniref:Uncharacterized protein n=1 Tax=Cotonvirus japonicus TaxID=2811091 RepID=A0ABM7NR86_9VIRU|nr:hypothetical protein QLL95_gp0180 [Cotonvirus japonicus]BCS82669.1 hypothetical protein [Cotonvirus japonicus]
MSFNQNINNSSPGFNNLIQHENDFVKSAEYVRTLVPNVFKHKISMITFNLKRNNNYVTCKGCFEFQDNSVVYSKCSVNLNGNYNEYDDVILEYSNNTITQNFNIKHNIFDSDTSLKFSDNSLEILYDMDIETTAYNKVMLVTLLYNFIVQTKNICNSNNELSVLNCDLIKKNNRKPSDKFIYLSDGNFIKFKLVK